MEQQQLFVDKTICQKVTDIFQAKIPKMLHKCEYLQFIFLCPIKQ